MAEQKVAFSIVTPSLNQGRFLAETIESVISQAGDFSIDYIIVDGGSSDNSVEIIKRYDALLQRGEWPVSCLEITFRWSSGPDRGQVDALSRGFGEATGEIFAWLNSDDTYLPGALQAAASFFQKHPETGLMYGDANYIDASGSVISNYHTEEFDFIRLASANIICQPAAFFRRDVFEALGGFDETLDFVMDYDLWLKISKRFPCRHVPLLLATYRLHESSKTISSASLYKNCEESLAITMRHCGWAPITRIYTSCRTRCHDSSPVFFTRHRILLVTLAVICTMFRSLWLNRGVHRNDLKLLNRKNMSKLSKSRLEIMTGR